LQTAIVLIILIEAASSKYQIKLKYYGFWRNYPLTWKLGFPASSVKAFAQYNLFVIFSPQICKMIKIIFLCSIMVLLPPGLPVVMSVIQVEIACPGYVYPNSNAALAFTGPAIATAVEDISRIYSPIFNFTLTFITDPKITDCITMMKNGPYLVAQWYYTRLDPTVLAAVIAPGMPFFLFVKKKNQKIEIQLCRLYGCLGCPSIDGLMEHSFFPHVSDLFQPWNGSEQLWAKSFIHKKAVFAKDLSERSHERAVFAKDLSERSHERVFAKDLSEGSHERAVFAKEVFRFWQNRSGEIAFHTSGSTSSGNILHLEFEHCSGRHRFIENT
jgi:hypothetical protein